MSKILHLSKLSRGYVEISESGSRLEIFADQTERPLIQTSKNNKLVHLPKTYSTKRGPLILFAETDLLKRSERKRHRDKRIIHRPVSLISPPPLRYGELKRSILEYGGTPENQCADGIVDEDGTFIYMKIPSKKRPHPSKYAGISPNILLKKRNIVSNNEDKRRDIDSMLDSEYSSSLNRRYSMIRTHVLSDEISLIPPIYRNLDINQHPPSVLSDAYRFYHIENTTTLNDNAKADEFNCEPYDTLQIIDSTGSQLTYETLEQSEKEKVLADLLIQTALQNISEQQNIEVFEDALHRVRDTDMNNSSSSMDLPILIEENSLSMIKSDTMSDHHHNQFIKSRQNSNESLPPPPPKYMFGKMQGSKWARNRPTHSTTLPMKSKHPITEVEQQSDEFSSVYTQTTSDTVHSKVFRASRMLAPISTSTHHDLSTIRHQSTKLPVKSRKSHENDLNQHKTTQKDHGHTQSKHLPSPNPSQEEKPKIDRLVEKEKISWNFFSRQRSSKSSKRNLSRQQTGKTFTTNRCVSSPLTADEEAERILGLDSFIQEDDDDNSSTQATIVEPGEVLVLNASYSAHTKENDENVHPSEMNAVEEPVIEEPAVPPVEVIPRRSAYTHRSHATTKSKVSSIVPPGALLIAPDGEVLSVGAPHGHFDRDDEEHLSKHDGFAQQSSAKSTVIDSTDQHSVIIAPCVPLALGTKRERLPGETVIRRTLNLTGGDFNSQIGLQSCSYEVSNEKRTTVPQPYRLVPPLPPIGPSAFTPRKYYHQKQVVQEVRDRAAVGSILSTYSEAVQHPPTVSHSHSKTRPYAESRSPLFSFTSWGYQHPPTPPIVKRPYLFRPDHRPAGASGYKHPLGDNETLIRRTINVHAGDIDASLSFTIWVYDMWINDLVKNGADPNYIKQVKSLFDLFKERRLSKVDLQDKEFLTALAHHAQALAKIILKRSDAGYRLAEDAQLAIIENIRNLKYILDQRLASVSDDVYREILRDTLQHVLIKGSLEHLLITDDILMALMDYPSEAFEIYLDPKTNEEYIRIKSAFRVRKNKIKPKNIKKKTKTIIICEEITVDDFERITDEHPYRFKEDFAEQKGLMELMEINFDIIKDKQFGKEFIQIETIPENLIYQVEIYTDPDTGKQILVWKKEALKTPPVIQSDITMEDFELVTDERTGETVLRLKADVANRKGLTGLAQTNFEIVVDPTTGQSIIRIKDDGLKQGNNRAEVVIDAITGKQTIRMIVDDDSNEPIVTITENDIDLNDFECVIDPSTGREILRMKADVLKSKGLEELANAEFEIVVDSITGQSIIVLKNSSIDFNGANNTNFEIIVDIVTRKQKIIKKIIAEQEDDHVDIIESQLNIDDFEHVVDPNTGFEGLRLKKSAAARKGLTNLLDVQFEIVTDADGKQKIVVKGGGNQGNSGDAKFELITDASGRTTIKVKKERPPTPELEVTEKPIDINDFEEIIDSKTGLKVLKLKADVAKRAGMMELLDTQFETYIDPNTGKQAIRVKQNDNNKLDEIKFEIVTDASGKQVLRMVQEIPKTVEVINSDINADDFEEIIDEKTGKKVLRMKKEVSKRKGFVDMDNVDFEYLIDQKTGQQVIQIKTGKGKLKKGNVSFEMITDPTTGQQTLRMKEEVEMKFDTIENDLATEDFEEVIDALTGERILKLTADAAARKGLTDLRDIAFEIYVDPTTGKEQIRMKDGNQTGKLDGDQKFEIYIDKKTGQQKIVLKRPIERTPPPVEKSIDVNDFKKVIDPNTGKEFYRFTDEAIRRKGLTNIKDMEFDIEIDATTGKTIMKPRVNMVDGQKVEVIVDPTTGKQTIRIVQEKPVKKLATITTTVDLDEKVFSIQVDAKTGKQIINLNKNLIENYGLENVEFEQIIDEKTGQMTYRMKPALGKDGKVYGLITDPKTGKQSLQVQEAVTQKQFTTLLEKRVMKGLEIPKPASAKTKTSDQIREERDTVPAEIPTRRTKKTVRLSPDKRTKLSPDKRTRLSPDKRTTLSPDKRMTFSPDKRTTLSPDKRITPSPDHKLTTANRRKSQVAFKPRPIRVKSASGQEYELEWTLDDEKELNGLNAYEQRKRKEQILAEKKRKVTEMKRQEGLAIQQRLNKQRDSLVSILEQSSELFNKEEQDRERDLRKLDADRDGLSEEEYQLHRKKLLAERTRVLKDAYDRKMDEGQQQTGEDDEEDQIHGEEDLFLSMMNPAEREDYIRARNEERVRQRLAAERERVQREEELQAALSETKRMAAIRAAEIMAKELEKRSANSMYAELKNLVTEQKVSRAFTYSYFSLLQFLSSNSSNPTN